ncbi:MAG: DEAD/DEAH box helicase, partial [Balneolaceae bacterium]
TDLMFTKQMEEMSEKRRSEAATLAALLDRLKEVGTSIEKRLTDGKQPTEEQNMEMELIDRKIREEGGREFLEERMEELSTVNERAELTGKQLVATTLAKVCTSELFGNVDFDAVVIDEGSMAGLPYLMVAASRAKWHRVIVGDPMQLPPIALTEKKEAREFLEKDIFTSVSGADTTESLFAWHDSQPGFTCFFDIQYRLEPALADVISKVFYDGRLRSGREKGDGGDIHADNRSYHLIDTSRYRPVLTQKSGERGFQPVNTVHQEVLERLIGNMLGKGIPPGDIGVMVPFRSPVYDLRNRLYEASIHGVEVGTIHTFQGREKPYIIFDTVMSGETRNGSIRHYSVRPLDESKNGLSVPRLLNVAFSRSRKELMILADMRHIHTVYGNKFLGKLLNRMKS